MAANIHEFLQEHGLVVRICDGDCENCEWEEDEE